MTTDRLAGLSREQRAALFEQIRKRKERAAAPPERIPRRPAGLDPVPASYAQERLWFLDRMAPGSALRSTLPDGSSGSRSSSTNAEGTM